MKRELQQKDIAGYLPYGLKYTNYHHGAIFIIELYNGGLEQLMQTPDLYKPVLRPLYDLYCTITHNGEEIVPIVELAKMAKLHLDYKSDWKFERGPIIDCAIKSDDLYFVFENGSFISYVDSGKRLIQNKILNQYALFDYLHELKIDYRGLIDAGLAIDVNTLESNPYE